jgi:hypothetical protein
LLWGPYDVKSLSITAEVKKKFLFFAILKNAIFSFLMLITKQFLPITPPKKSREDKEWLKL